MFDTVNRKRKSNLLEDQKSVSNTFRVKDNELNHRDIINYQQSYEPTYHTDFNYEKNAKNIQKLNFNSRISNENFRERDIEKSTNNLEHNDTEFVDEILKKNIKDKVTINKTKKMNNMEINYEGKEYSVKGKTILSDERIYLNCIGHPKINDYVVNIEKNAILFTLKKFRFKKYILDMNKIHAESKNNFFEMDSEAISELVKDSIKELMKNDYQLENGLRVSKYFIEIPIYIRINKFEKIKYLKANLDTNHIDNTMKAVEKMLKDNFTKLTKVFNEAYSKNIQLNKKKDEYRRLYNDLYA